ncbi:MAG: hypothetical protein RL042_1520 [Nitrospirota bacterium]|jgi:hypothetical protein
MMTRVAVLVMAVLFTDVLPGLPGAVAESEQKASNIPAEDYALYDQVVTSKFLTSATRLVVIERMTRLRLSPGQEEPTEAEHFHEGGYFDGELPADLIQEFISINRQPGRLEGRFHVGVSYRFVTGDTIEAPEVSLTRPVTVAHVKPVQAPEILERLAFSRVARSLRNDQALLYVEALRPDGTGAGFLIWFHRRGRDWVILDTEVVWAIQAQEEPEGGPLLAP